MSESDTFKPLGGILTNAPKPKGFQPGHPGGPGRPLGSRHRISEMFLRDFMVAWERSGVEALNKVAEDKPHEFVRAAVALLPKELHVKTDALEAMSDDDLLEMAATLKAYNGLIAKQAKRKAKPPQPEQIN